VRQGRELAEDTISAQQSVNDEIYAGWQNWDARAARPTHGPGARPQQTRLAFGQALLEIGAHEPKYHHFAAPDLLGIRPFIERFRERFVELGIAEQNVIGAASGLATTGLRPYVCAYAPFITARSMEQVRNDLAYANQRVVIGAAASGISLGVAGGTHHAMEDIALMRSLPNMTVIVPADVDEAYRARDARHRRPVYIRLGGRVEPPVSRRMPFRLGRLRACSQRRRDCVRGDGRDGAASTLKEGVGVRYGAPHRPSTRCGLEARRRPRDRRRREHRTRRTGAPWRLLSVSGDAHAHDGMPDDSPWSDPRCRWKKLQHERGSDRGAVGFASLEAGQGPALTAFNAKDAKDAKVREGNDGKGRVKAKRWYRTGSSMRLPDVRRG
jgi:hypothetical protein